MTKVKIKATPETRSMTVLPPAPDKCQVCATKHKPEMPHNAQSLYYQMTFNIQHKRGPTWKDAMKHCTRGMRAIWKEELLKLGVDIEKGEIHPRKTMGIKGPLV